MQKILIGILAIVVLIGGSWYLNQKKAVDTTADVANMPGRDMAVKMGDLPGMDAAVMKDVVAKMPSGMAMVMYTDKGFEPKTVTVKPGQKVAFMNHSAGQLVVGFGEHLHHSEYPDKIDHPGVDAGGTIIVTFPAAGTFGYHNHLAEENTGMVVVK